MVKKGTRIRSARVSSGAVSIKIRVAGTSKKTVKFGSVTIAKAPVDKNIIQRNIEEGQQALARAAKKLSQPGVTIKAAKGVPLYSVDQTRPDLLIRKLDGRTERGILENGQFKVVNE